MPVTTRHPDAVVTVTRAGKSSPMPSGYGKTLVPLTRRKSDRDHAIALSRVSARKSNRTSTGPGAATRIRQVS